MSRFSSGMAMSPGTTATGGLSERNRQINRLENQIERSLERRNQGFDPSGFNAPVDRSKPPQLTPAKGISPPFRSKFDVNKVMNNIDNQIAANTGVAALNPNQSNRSVMGLGANLAQQVLGDSYPQALALGYEPNELMNMVTEAQAYNRGIDIDKFKTDLDRFQGFEEAGGGIFKFDEPQDDGSTVSKQYLSVSRPELSANAPTLAQLMGDIGGGINEMVGAGADFALGGGALGRVFGGLKDTYTEGKNFMGDVFNPGNLTQRILSLTPEQQRMYYQLLPNMTYQQAFEQASGQAFARGGISSLN